jgi:hypothetical protein
MHLLQNLSDDQTALLGCFAALSAAGLLMSLSYYFGRWNKLGRSHKPGDAITHRLPQAGDKPSKRAA